MRCEDLFRRVTWSITSTNLREEERSDSEGDAETCRLHLFGDRAKEIFYRRTSTGKEEPPMKRAANISVILDHPRETQRQFNEIVSDYGDIIRGRMGIPFEGSVALISLTVVAELDHINSFTGKLGKLPGVTVKASIAREGVRVE
jgi:putative iron-only hydrogenase system regulator